MRKQATTTDRQTNNEREVNYHAANWHENVLAVRVLSYQYVATRDSATLIAVPFSVVQLSSGRVVCRNIRQAQNNDPLRNMPPTVHSLRFSFCFEFVHALYPSKVHEK